MLLASLRYSDSAKLFPETRFDLEPVEFLPSRALPTGHLQTVAAVVIPVRRPLPSATGHIVETTGGDQLVLHENRPSPGLTTRRDVLLLHGVGGCHASPYMTRTAEVLLQAGFRVWRLDQRGCGAGTELARHHHHAGRVEDLEAAIGAIRQRTESPCPLSVVGFSLGGNLLLKWLANWERVCRTHVDSAIAIAPPVDLMYCINELNRGLGRWYDLFFGKTLRGRMRERRRARPDILDRPINPMPRKLFEFDDRFTAPLGGFADARDYYCQCSSIHDLGRIRTNTLIVADEDDPVVPFEMFHGCRLSSSVQLVTTSRGGHIGYIARRGIDQSRFWIGWRICDWLTGIADDRMFSAT